MNIDRRQFLSSAAAAAACAAVPRAFAGDAAFIRAFFIRLGQNISFIDRRAINFNEALWNHQFEYAKKAGLNLALIDVCDGVRYESHPEIASFDAKPVEWLRAEVKRIRAMGLEPIPKLNFSAAHDGWLGKWRYCRCTPDYYRVCREVIREVHDIFGQPRFVHIGMDEEDMDHMGKRELVTFRRGELWWHDFLEFVADVEACGARAWMWSDYGWHHAAEFVKRCPKSVMHSNWYYDEGMFGFDLKKAAKTYVDKFSLAALKLYVALDKAGFDQIPCGSVWVSPQREKAGVKVNDSMTELIAFCRANVSPEHLKGFLMASWVNYQHEGSRVLNEHAIDLVARG